MSDPLQEKRKNNVRMCSQIQDGEKPPGTHLQRSKTNNGFYNVYVGESENMNLL